MTIAVDNSVNLIEQSIKRAEEMIAKAESELQSLSVSMKETLAHMGHSRIGVLSAAEKLGADQKQAAEINQELQDASARLLLLVCNLDSVLCKFLIEGDVKVDLFQSTEDQANRQLSKSADPKAASPAKPKQPNLIEQAQKDFDLLMQLLKAIADSSASSLSGITKKDQTQNSAQDLAAGHLANKEIAL